MKSFDVRLRAPNGEVLGYLVEDVPDWETARDVVAMALQFELPRCIMVAERVRPIPLELDSPPDVA